MIQNSPAEFYGTPLNVVEHHGQKWLTAEQAGTCLGYDQSNARNRVTKIFERHSDEFTEEDTCAVKLTVQGQARTVRIFSATGCIKLGFFAQTPRAAEFRTWSSKVLAAHQQGLDLISHQQQLSLAREIGVLRASCLSKTA